MLIFTFILAVSIPALGFLGFRVIMFVSDVFHFVFGGSSTRVKWPQATFSGLWPLPYACTLGVAIWLTYSIVPFGGWPYDVVFGALSHLAGAWVYLTIFQRWFILRRSSTPHPHATPGNT